MKHDKSEASQEEVLSEGEDRIRKVKGRSCDTGNET